MVSFTTDDGRGVALLRINEVNVCKKLQKSLSPCWGVCIKPSVNWLVWLLGRLFFLGLGGGFYMFVCLCPRGHACVWLFLIQ